MLQEEVYQPTFRSRVEGKLLSLYKSGIQKLAPRVGANPVKSQNAVAWCLHGEVCTRVVFFNYLWRNHHEEWVILDLQLLDAEGNELWRESRTVGNDETTIVDSAEIAKAVGLKEFEGYLVLTTSLAKMPQMIDLIRFNVDYYTDTGLISSVHDQAIFGPSFPENNHSLGKMEVVETADIGTALIFLNSLIYANVPVTAKIEVKRHDGQSIDIGSYSLEPKKMLRVELGKEQPGLETFLQGKPGQVIVESNYYIRRAAVLQYSKKKLSSWYSVNHSEEYRGKPPYLTRNMILPVQKEGSSPMSPLPFFHNFRSMTTDFVVFHDVPAAGETQTYGLTLFDQNGTRIFHGDNVTTVPLHGTGRIAVKDFLPEDQSVYGLAQVFLAGEPHNTAWQQDFPADAHYLIDGGKWDAMYGQGSYRKVNAGEGTRARVFSRIYYDEQFETDLIFIHPSTAADESDTIGETSTQVTLCHPNGKMTITRELKLKPFSTRLVKVAELFPEIETFGMRPGLACGVYVRDVTAKVLVVHLTRNKDNSSIATDHFYGG